MTLKQALGDYFIKLGISMSKDPMHTIDQAIVERGYMLDIWHTDDVYQVTTKPSKGQALDILREAIDSVNGYSVLDAIETIAYNRGMLSDSDYPTYPEKD